MKISVDKSRLALALISLGAVLVIGALIYEVVFQSHQISFLESKIKLHALPIHPLATSTPTATPTASLKFYPSKGIVK